jgi:hypothetical protein
MPTTISRSGSASDQISITADAATSGGFSVNGAVGVLIYLDTVTTATSMTFYLKTDSKESVSYQLVDSSNTAVSQNLTQGKCFALPTLTTYGARYVIPVVNAGSAAIRVTYKG